MSLFDRFRKTAPPPPPAPPKPSGGFSDEELLARADAFNRAADVYWRDVMAEPSARRHVLNKPVSSVVDTPAMLYRLGLLLSELRLGLGHTVLDFGAGSCWLASCLNRLGCHTIAVDVSPAALDVGRELFRIDPRHRPELDPRFLAYDGHRLPLPDASVDRIACFDAFHHIPNQDEVLREFRRVLRPGGRAVLAEPGEGHSHSELSTFEADRCGVLENELDVLDLDRRARQAGFTRVTLKPYPGPDVVSLGAADYVRLMDGDAAVYPMPALQRSLRDFFLVTLTSGEEVIDSRRPGHLHADLRVEGGGAPHRAAPAETLRLPLRIRNSGDTLWLHAMNEAGGYVMLAGNLIDASGHRVRPGFFRASLPRDVPPGDEVALVAEIPLPHEAGAYQIELDLVDEHVMWFSQAGSAPLRVAVEVEGGARPTDDLRARIELPSGGALRALPGTRVRADVRLTNLGTTPWPHATEPQPHTVSLAAHLLDGAGRMFARDVVHRSLPTNVAPDESLDVAIDFKAPLEPGAYRLKVDLVLEHVCWFEQRGSAPLLIVVEVADGIPDSADPGVLAASIEALDTLPSPAAPGTELAIRIRVRNLGNTRWLAPPRPEGGHVAVGAHLLDASRAVAVLDYARAPLPRDVLPGESVEVSVRFHAPAQSGSHVVEVDLVHEGRAWFAALGSPTLRLPLHIA